MSRVRRVLQPSPRTAADHSPGSAAAARAAARQWPGLPIVRMRRHGAPPPGTGAPLSGPEEAGRRLRREATARARARALGAALAGLLTAVGVGVAHRLIRGEPPTVWVVVALGVAAWLGLAVHARRVAGADVADVDHPHAATIVMTRPGQVVVRDSTGAAWRWRHRPTGRELVAGERGWVFLEGSPLESPHLVMAYPVGPERYVVWAAPDREIVRVPDPQAEHDTGPLATAIFDEPDS